MPGSSISPMASTATFLAPPLHIFPPAEYRYNCTINSCFYFVLGDSLHEESFEVLKNVIAACHGHKIRNAWGPPLSEDVHWRSHESYK